MADDTDSMCRQIKQNLVRHVNCLGEENRNTRKRAIDGIRKEILTNKLEPVVIQSVLEDIAKPVLKLFADPVEKCRELSIALLAETLRKTSSPDEYLHYVIPVFVQRIGQQDIIEPSEEIRLQLVELLSQTVARSGKKLGIYLDDMIKILQRTLVDPYPEVRKESCRCARSYAKAVPEHFHMQSESLIKPLLLSMSHQHAKVRVEVILAIGDVIQYGNGKSVDDVVSHLAQRLFDQSPAVRTAVTKVAGMWLLDLPDRYSFHHKLMPLLLTSITDEMPDIKQLASDLWYDIGLKYEGENENDLKDKQDFVKPDPDHYPIDVERPNLGCRTLVYRNLSKILPGLLRDLADWVAATRIKSACLLYTLLMNAEDNMTQHMEKLVSGLSRACGDEEAEVVTMVDKSAELIGFFVPIDVWCKMTLDVVKKSQSFGSLMVLAAVIRGSERSQLVPYMQDICSVLVDPDLCHSVDEKTQWHLLSCVHALIEVTKDSCAGCSFQLFKVLVSVQALTRLSEVLKRVQNLLTKLAEAQDLPNKQELFNQHTKAVVESLEDNYVMWTNHSVERLIFDSLLMESGPVVGELLEEVIPILAKNMDPEKDPEVRLKFFSLLSRLMMNSANTLDSQHRFGDFAVIVIKDMIIPNCVWKAGKTAAAIRTTAVSCLWALLQSGVLDKEKISPVIEDLLTQLVSLLEDDNKSTRLVCCRVLTQLFSSMGEVLDQDRLHNLYPDLLKRLDDSSDDIRVEVSRSFRAYLQCFKDCYDVGLYRAHLEAIYRGLLVHLDDPEEKIQDAVLEILKVAAAVCPSMLMQEVDAVRHKHRNTKYCDALANYVNSLGS